MGRQRNFMPSRYAGQAEPAAPARAATTGRALATRTRRSAATFTADYRARRLLEGLGQMRIAGRHSAAAVSARLLAACFEEYGVRAEQGRAAYEAGQADRARGVPCMCAACAGRALGPAAAHHQEGTP